MLLTRLNGLLLGRVLLVGSLVSADSFTFDTLPTSGDILGLPGSRIGWGYTLTNTSLTNWLVPTSLGSDPFLAATPNAIFDFPILAPGATLSVAYDSLTGIGLFELTWEPGVPIGTVNLGLFVIEAEWWDGDPLGGGSFVELAELQSAPYMAIVVSGTTVIPELSTLALLATGIGALRSLRRRTAGRRGGSR
jgi:hypothetical protein